MAMAMKGEIQLAALRELVNGSAKKLADEFFANLARTL